MLRSGRPLHRFLKILRAIPHRWPDYLAHRAHLWLTALLFRPFYHHCVPARQDAPVLICTMGKVGTVSLQVSLRRRGWQFTFVCHRIRRRPESYPFVDRAARRRLRAQRFLSRYQFPWMLRQPRVRVITAVREPIARLVSLYLYAYSWRFDGAIVDADMDTLLARFPRFLEREFEHPLIPAEFLATEMHGTLGIDVFAHPFDAAQGWTTIEHQNISLLICKSELPDTGKQAALTQWLQRPMRLDRFNSADDHAYGACYAEFKRRVRIPYRYAAQIYASRFMHHFYTAEERTAFWRRWEPQLDRSLPLPAWVEASLDRHHPPYAPPGS